MTTQHTGPLVSLVAKLRADAAKSKAAMSYAIDEDSKTELNSEANGMLIAADELQTVLDAMCDAVAVIQCARFENFELKDFCGAHQVFDSQGTERWGTFTKQEATK